MFVIFIEFYNYVIIGNGGGVIELLVFCIVILSVSF